jgi:hypothetical protein
VPARTIIESNDVSQILDDLRETYARFEEVWDGWTWRLCRDPLTDAVQVHGSNPQAFLIKFPDLSNYGFPPTVRVLYTFTDNELNILYVSAEVN